MRVVIDWQVSSFFGWGVYGLNLALQWADNPAVEARAYGPLDPHHVAIDSLAQRALRPFILRSMEKEIPPDAIRLASLGNGLRSAMGRESTAPIGVAFFEQPLDAAAVERSKRHHVIVAGSSWNAERLRAAGVRCQVETILQGVDPTLFRPGPKRALFKDRFLIFSGGKAEPRKGQDLVVKAFRIFAARHPEAMLVTAWHSPWPQLREGMDLDLSDLADRVIDVGHQPNVVMPQIYRDCDVGLFPNRAEGGTNLVAMECLACGVPVILSANTGHLDLIGRDHVFALRRQLPSETWVGGGESDLDEIVARLETTFTSSRPGAVNPIADLTWAETARKLLATVERVHGQRQAA